MVQRVGHRLADVMRMQLTRARDVFGEPLAIGLGKLVEERELRLRRAQNLREILCVAQGASTAARDSSEMGFVM